MWILQSSLLQHSSSNIDLQVSSTLLLVLALTTYTFVEVLEARSQFIAKIAKSTTHLRETDTLSHWDHIIQSEFKPLGPESFLVQPFTPRNLFNLIPDTAIAKLTAQKIRIEAEIERQHQRKMIKRDPERVSKLRLKIPSVKDNLKHELQVRKVRITAMRATRDKAKVKAVEFYRDHEDAERLLGEMEESFGRRREEGNAEVQVLYSAYLQAGGERDLEMEFEVVGENDEIDIEKRGKHPGSVREDGSSAPLDKQDKF
jgi:hypothetical protein